MVNALLLSATREEADGQIFNLGGETSISLKDLAALLVEVNGGGEFIMRSFPEERKRIDIGDYYADWNRIQSALGWKPNIPLREGISRTLEYYRSHLDKYI